MILCSAIIFLILLLTQWVGDDLQNISAFYGGPSNELNWTFLNDRQRSSLWQGDDGTTQTLDAWENACVVRTNPDGTLSAKLNILQDFLKLLSKSRYHVCR